MFPELRVLVALIRATRARWTRLHDGEAGYTTEAVIVIAVMAGLALAVLAVIYDRVTAKANSISLS